MTHALDLAIALAVQAGRNARVLRDRGISVETKSDDSPVTVADKEGDAIITQGLRAAFPSDGILSEETEDDGSRHTCPRVWMVDPIDGTSDFIRGHDGFASMIGLIDGERPVLGVVYQPVRDRVYYATLGGGAFEVDGDRRTAPVPLHVSKISEMTDIRMVASKSHRSETIDRVREELGISDELNVGSVGLKLAFIANGERDLYVNPSPHSKLWDVCAPEIILVEAGGRITDATGARISYRRQDLGNLRGLIASNGLVHDAVVERLGALFQHLRASV